MEMQQLIERINKLEEKVKVLEEIAIELTEAVQLLFEKIGEYEDMAIQKITENED